MLVRQGGARSHDEDRHLAWLLASVAGALNAAGFYAAGLYSSNMTGNVSGVADHLARGDFAPAAAFLSLVAAFVTGAAVSALLINAGRRRGLAGIYAFSILAEALLLAALALAELRWPGLHRGLPGILALSCLRGRQNAVVTRISEARVRTTHVTGMVTDIGIELGNLIDVATRRAGPGGVRPNREKLRLHGWTVLAFGAGGVVGVLGFRFLGPFLLLGAAALLLPVALPAILATRRAGSGGLPGRG